MKSGFNRIGVYFNPSVAVVLKKSQLDVGVKYYGPDKVFEKNTPGISVAYSYLYTGDKLYCGPTVNYAFFSEKKTGTTVHLTELNLGNSLGIKLSNHFSIYSTIAIGVVLNKAKSDIITTKINYLNYEIALGINYRFGSSDR